MSCASFYGPLACASGPYNEAQLNNTQNMLPHQEKHFKEF
jgi:hypothetical protein